ncbi:MAG: M20/M25/M40 family metallo-hydrolase, partial [Gammaproteobacteria bacterium]|nr:M20/M25/M40 family metallo-hydrolase [Gammaproteobacteria bacterium]
MQVAATECYVTELWNESIVAALVEYIKIPNKSPAFDAEWAAHGYMDDAVALIGAWCKAHALAGMTIEVVRLDGRTPVIFMELPPRSAGDDADCVLLYGHLDKQPEMQGWREGLGPWTPVLEGDRLYGRGGADDGYAAFASIAALGALAEQGLEHARCVILIEACEESGSYDLPHYIDALAPRIGEPSLVVCLDSGCGNYDQLWCTTSLRGLAAGSLRVEVLSEGVHSGDAGGIVPGSFRLARALLSRVEDEASGRVGDTAFCVDIPLERRAQAAEAARVLGDAVYDKFPFVPGVRPVTEDLTELVLNRTWRPALEVTGQAGLPALADAGNVARPMTALKLSLRLPPTSDARRAAARLGELLERDPPSGARTSFRADTTADGWSAPPTSAWLDRSVREASREY